MHTTRANETKIVQGKRRVSVKYYLKLNSNARQRKESKKSATTTKQHSRNQGKKKSTKASTLFVLAKTLEVKKKRRQNVKQQ